MSLIAEFDLSAPQLPLTDVAAIASDCELRVEDVLTADRTRHVLVCWADGMSFDTLETTLDGEETVSTYSVLGVTGTRRLYRIELTAEVPPIYTAFVVLETAPIDARITETGWRVRTRFSDRRALAQFYRSCRSYDISFRLDRLYEANPASEDGFGLTRKQHETLLVAHQMGYFDIPRTTSLAAIGERLGISAPSVSERLRRAQDRLVQHTIAFDGPSL